MLQDVYIIFRKSIDNFTIVHKILVWVALSLKGEIFIQSVCWNFWLQVPQLQYDIFECPLPPPPVKKDKA